MNITDEQVLNFILRVVAPSVLGAGGHFLKKKLIDKVEDAEDIFQEVGIITTEMREVITQTHFQRFLLFRSENGKAKRTASVILEDFRKPIKSVYNDYQNLSTDAHYDQIIKGVQEDKMIHIVTADIPEDAMLKRIYEAEGIYSSYVFLLCKTKKWLYYASIATTEQMQVSKIEKNKVELSKGKIKAVFEKYRKAIGD